MTDILYIPLSSIALSQIDKVLLLIVAFLLLFGREGANFIGNFRCRLRAVRSEERSEERSKIIAPSATRRADVSKESIKRF